MCFPGWLKGYFVVVFLVGLITLVAFVKTHHSYIPNGLQILGKENCS